MIGLDRKNIERLERFVKAVESIADTLKRCPCGHIRKQHEQGAKATYCQALGCRCPEYGTSR